MNTPEPKKLAIVRILQILEEHSDCKHPMTQEDIASHLERDYGITIERKAIGRNLSLLKEAGFEIESTKSGSYLDYRTFENSELRLLIDSVLSSRHITAKHSKSLIERLCGLTSKYFRAHIKNIHSVNEWSKTNNQALFYNIEMADTAIEERRQITFDYNKYGTDKKLHRTTTHVVSPYQLILHNQRYYLMGLNERWHNMGYYRLDRITNMTLSENKLTPLSCVEGYERGINYAELATSLPYMYTDKPQTIVFSADIQIVDQIVDWFGDNARIIKKSSDTIEVTLKASVLAMEYWAMQYLNHVEILRPESLRSKICENLRAASTKYNNATD